MIPRLRMIRPGPSSVSVSVSTSAASLASSSRSSSAALASTASTASTAALLSPVQQQQQQQQTHPQKDSRCSTSTIARTANRTDVFSGKRQRQKHHRLLSLAQSHKAPPRSSSSSPPPTLRFGRSAFSRGVGVTNDIRSVSTITLDGNRNRHSHWISNSNSHWIFHSHSHSHWNSQSPRFLSHTPKRSPYAVLGLTGSRKGVVTKGEIRTAFRRLAKEYHPDLNHPRNGGEQKNGRTKRESEALMAELVEAYRILRNDGKNGDAFADRFKVGHSNVVALACDLYSLDELRMDRFHEVYDLTMDFEDALGEHREDTDWDCDCDDADDADDYDDDPNHGNGNGNVGTPGNHHQGGGGTALVPVRNRNPGLLVRAHPEDSVSDLKRQLEADHGAAWGLEDRMSDRDGLSVGWELVVVRGSDDGNDNDNGNDDGNGNGNGNGNNNDNGNSNDNGNDNGNRNGTNEGITNEVLSYHLFLDDYGIRHGDTVYAIVRKHGTQSGDD